MMSVSPPPEFAASDPARAVGSSAFSLLKAESGEPPERGIVERPSSGLTAAGLSARSGWRSAPSLSRREMRPWSVLGPLGVAAVLGFGACNLDRPPDVGDAEPSSSVGALVSSSDQVSRAGEGSAREFADIFEDVESGVVQIFNNGCGTETTGTGFFVGDHLIATAAHVVEGSELSTVVIAGEEVIARIVSADPETDLALLLVESTYEAHVFEMDSEIPRAGSAVAAIGFPLGLEMSIATGTMSSQFKDPDGSGPTFLQTDTAVNPGNSGGPLLNAFGNVVGVVDLKLSDSEGLAFAVSSADLDQHISSWDPGATPEAAPCPQPDEPVQADRAQSPEVSLSVTSGGYAVEGRIGDDPVTVLFNEFSNCIVAIVGEKEGVICYDTIDGAVRGYFDNQDVELDFRYFNETLAGSVGTSAVVVDIHDNGFGGSIGDDTVELTFEPGVGSVMGSFYGTGPPETSLIYFTWQLLRGDLALAPVEATPTPSTASIGSAACSGPIEFGVISGVRDWARVRSGPSLDSFELKLVTVGTTVVYFPATLTPVLDGYRWVEVLVDDEICGYIAAQYVELITIRE